ncbi:MAG: hypothetical protein KC417_03755, partial [Myxococcales bacterium]|nr:hypothetical protein [Myxococcales bacterium]
MRLWIGVLCTLVLGCHDFDALVRRAPHDASVDGASDAVGEAGTDAAVDTRRVRPSFVNDAERALAGTKSLVIPANAEAVLVVEAQGDTHEEVRQQLQAVTQRLVRRKRLAFHSITTQERDERDLYWRLARRVVPRLYQLRGSQRPLPLVEDIAVPPEV